MHQEALPADDLPVSTARGELVQAASRLDKRRISRRTVAGVLALTAAAAACRPLVAGNEFPLGPDYRKLDLPEPRRLPAAYEPLDVDRLAALVTELRASKGVSARDAARAVRENLCWIAFVRGGGTSALLLDHAGLYLTTAHTFDGRTERGVDFQPTSTPAMVYHLEQGTLTQVSSYLVDGVHDIAFFNAVSGEAPRPVSGIGFELTPPAVNQRAWMHAVRNDGAYAPTPDFWCAVLTGRVTDIGLEMPITGIEDRMPIEGMIPFGGASGAPVINKRGRIIGVESGFYPSGARSRKHYRGATVTRLRAIASVLQIGRVHRLRQAS